MTAACREHEKPLTLSGGVLACPECTEKRAVRAKVDAMITANPEDSIEILSAGSAEHSDLSTSAKKFVTRCQQAGWFVSLRKSATTKHQAPTKTGPNAGELKPDLHSEHIFVVCWTEGIWFQAAWERANNKNLFRGATVFDPVGIVWETDEGTMMFKPGMRQLKAAGQFEGWLNIVCADNNELEVA